MFRLTLCFALLTLVQLHVHGIIHRDLKYENSTSRTFLRVCIRLGRYILRWSLCCSVMFVDESPDAEVRIIDFGLSQKFAANQHLHDAVGTVYVCLKLGDIVL